MVYQYGPVGVPRSIAETAHAAEAGRRRARTRGDGVMTTADELDGDTGEPNLNTIPDEATVTSSNGAELDELSSARPTPPKASGLPQNQ